MTELRFDNKVAIVTGAGRGIGREHALLLAGRGASVVVNDHGGAVDGTGSSADPSHDVVDAIHAAGGRAVANDASVATADGAASIVAAAHEAFGPVDIVVNNAGIIVPGRFPDIPADAFARVVDVHVAGTINVIRAAWEDLRAADAGRIVNTASNALLGWPELSPYSTAKAAILGLTRTLAIEGAPHGMRVNAIAPGGWTRLSESGSPVPDDVRTWAEAVLRPWYNAAVVGFLAHESCDLNGEVLGSWGGRVTRLFISETEGYLNRALAPEDVAANQRQIMDTTGATVCAGGLENVARVMQTLAGVTADDLVGFQP